MAIHLHRSNRAEALVAALCAVLQSSQPDDPFLPYPIVVGSRGMERWLRHEIATHNDIAAGLAFPFPRQALAGAARWLMDGAALPNADFWDLPPEARQSADRWLSSALAFELVGAIRAQLDAPEFESVNRYLSRAEDTAGSANAGVVSARELLFAGEVGDVLDRLMHDRPERTLQWAKDPDSAPDEHRWLAKLLCALNASTDPYSPLVQHHQLVQMQPRPTGRSMCIFGLSTMGPGDRERLAAIARSMDVHLFVLVPTQMWFEHQRTRIEANAARRDTQSDADRDALEAELQLDNPVLTALGVPSRDLQIWLENIGYQPGLDVTIDPVASPPSQQPPTLLHRLQSWILWAQGMDQAKAWPFDASLSCYSTYGPLRQVEVLRDALLSMFDADDTLECRDVLVMTPDIETFAPLVAAVFSRSGPAVGGAGQRLPRIPISVSDLGLSQTNPVAEVLLKVLEISGERLCASWMIDFIALQPVRLRWALDDDDLADIRQLIRESGLRWGVDAADRATVGQPALDQNTARFAMERLALGVLMPDEGALDVVHTPAAPFGPAVPLNIEGRDRQRRLGQLGAILNTLAAHREALRTPATLEEWRARLVCALDALSQTAEASSWVRAEVDVALDEMARLGGQLDGLLVDRAAVLRSLQGGFETPQKGDRPITGAVQVCALEPMRSVPFRVVALLGMDDKIFPRRGRARTWDPMEQRQPGERDRRETDRHLLLEAMLSARDRLILLWSGHDVQQGREQPAAVPVEELLETLGTLSGHDREQLVQTRPLQPWSAGNFNETSGSFDHGLALAAQQLHDIERDDRRPSRLGLMATGQVLLPQEAFLPKTLSIDALADALLAPHKLLLRDRLGLSVSFEAAQVEDREPLELDTLDEWSLRTRMVEHLLDTSKDWTDDALLAALRDRVAGEGLLPMCAGGEQVLGAELDKAQGVVSNLTEIAGLPAAPLELSLQLDGCPLLVGQISRVVAHGTDRLGQWYTVSKGANERLRLRAWLHLVTAVAAGHSSVSVRLVGHGSTSNSKGAGGDFMTFDGTAEDAQATLAGLVEVWRQARRQPIPLFKKTSFAAASALEKFGDDLEAPGAMGGLKAAVEGGWHGGYMSIGDVDDRWIRAFHLDYDPTGTLDDQRPLSLVGLARQIWLPICRSLKAGKVLGAKWQAGAGQ